MKEEKLFPPSIIYLLYISLTYIDISLPVHSENSYT